MFSWNKLIEDYDRVFGMLSTRHNTHTATSFSYFSYIYAFHPFLIFVIYFNTTIYVRRHYLSK